MALTREVLDDLCTHGFGPLTMSNERSGWTATVGGRSAHVRFDGPALEVASARTISRPAGGLPAGEIEARTAIALRQLELTREELCVLRADSRAGTVTADCWLDASTASVMDVARTVRNTVALADLAARALEQVRIGVDADARARAEAEAAVSALDNARKALVETAQASAAAPPRAPMPPQATPPPHEAVPAGQFHADRVAPAGGLRAWSRADPGAPELAPIPPGTPLHVSERLGAWVHVSAANGLSAWVDGRMLP